MYEHLKKALKEQTSTLTDNLARLSIKGQVDLDSSEKIVSIISMATNLIDILDHDSDEFEEIAVTYLLVLASLIAQTHTTLYGKAYVYDPRK